MFEQRTYINLFFVVTYLNYLLQQRPNLEQNSATILITIAFIYQQVPESNDNNQHSNLEIKILQNNMK